MKGQWYLVAGVLISFSLVSFFFIFYSYSRIDFTSVIKNREDEFAMNLYFVLNKTISNSESANKLVDVADLLELFGERMERKGYFVEFKCTASEINLTLSGDKMKIKITR